MKVSSLAFSPHPLRTLWFAMPLAALFWVAAAPRRDHWGADLLIGAVWWTFAEYAFHRWLYHWRPRFRPARALFDAIHLAHHREIDDRSRWNAGPLLALPIALLLGLPALLATRDWPRTAQIMLGTVLAYFVYEWVHYAVHARAWKAWPLSNLQGFHLHHHHGDVRTCFGVTNPFWDLLFFSAVPRAQWKSRK